MAQQVPKIKAPIRTVRSDPILGFHSPSEESYMLDDPESQRIKQEQTKKYSMLLTWVFVVACIFGIILIIPQSIQWLGRFLG